MTLGERLPVVDEATSPSCWGLVAASTAGEFSLAARLTQKLLSWRLFHVGLGRARTSNLGLHEETASYNHPTHCQTLPGHLL